MSSIKIGGGSISSTLFTLPFDEFMAIVKRNKGFRGDIIEKAIEKMYYKINPNDTKAVYTEIRATPTGEAKRGGGQRNRKK